MRTALLSGGVGGARLARGLAAIPEVDLAVIVNVGDDEEIYGLSVSPDLDTVVYTLAAAQGPQGWGLADDAFTVMGWLDGFPIETDFAIGDRDLATNLFRTDRLRQGWGLSLVTAAIASAFGVAAQILPATEQKVRTQVKLQEGGWIGFQEYFVARAHRDEIEDVRFAGADQADAGPGVIEAIEGADLLVVGPSNPPLSIWPVLAIGDIARAVGRHERVVGVSPLIGGKALKGPADRVLRALGFAAGNLGVVEAYGDLLHDLFVDPADAEDTVSLPGVRVHVADLDLQTPEAAARFARQMLEML
jgi:LPPG:FO 2-phospho-L-lactate transferase